MGPKKAPSARPVVNRVRNTVEVKKEIIAKYESGVRIAELARQYGKAYTTISTIVAKGNAIKEAVVAKGANMITKQRPQILEDVETLLLVWINEKELAGDSVTQAIISEKARQLHADLLKKMPETSAEVSEFKASKGWFDRFKKRSGIHSVIRHGEAASADKCAAEKYIQEFKDYVEAEGFVPQQVFNCDETGLFWKKMPNRTYITQEEKALPGHKPMKDRLTLMLCSNASGDFKVKPLLVYHSENPRVFKKYSVAKANLCVMWKANSKAWVTREIFLDWFNEVFGPSVKKYLLENNLKLKCLLVMDNAPAHPRDMAEQIVEEFKFIKVKFLPPNTTPLLQPMDQQVISNFKKLYTKAMFQRCFDITSDTHLTLREFWKDHFSIFHCITHIGKAWEDVTSRTLNSAWKKLWPDCVPERDFEGFGAEPQSPEPVVEKIVALGKSLGLDVSAEDVEELVEDHNEVLTTADLQELHQQCQQTTVKEIDAEQEEEIWRTLPSSKIKDMCTKWTEVQRFMEHYHPNKAVSGRVGNMYNENVVSHFREVLKMRQTQSTLDNFFVHNVSSDSQAGPSASKKQRREGIPERDLLPKVLMEGDSPSKQ